MILGLEAGIAALAEIQRLSELSGHGREALLDQVIRRLLDNRNPFLITLADAIEEGLIHAQPDR